MQEITVAEPRNEKELCQLFEDLLFMRTEKFLAREVGKKGITLSPENIDLLGALGITSRIFRRWYQTTWHYHDFASKHFSGMTPRQELSIRYPTLATGHTYISAEMVKMGAEPKIIPHFFSQNMAEFTEGVFSYGKSQQLQKEKTAGKTILTSPSYDIGFKEFTLRMEEVEQDIKKYKIIQLSKISEKRYWQLFWHDTPITLALNSELKLPHDRLIELSVALHFLFNALVKRQGKNSGDFMSFDELFYNVWRICQDFDSKLLPLDKILVRDARTIPKILELENGEYSFSVYYNLTNLLDELFLFPADRYFGAVECVWIDKESFLRDLMVTFELLKNNLRTPFLNKGHQEKYPGININEKATDIYRLWFSPPTAFRILPRTLEFMG